MAILRQQRHSFQFADKPLAMSEHWRTIYLLLAALLGGLQSRWSLERVDYLSAVIYGGKFMRRTKA
jgi:hypothetical protein